ncbi:MAG: bifunctional phosphoglucose/phosphomannose isomerase [Bacteroidetes bacterium]|nr:bifunctional phosphoglucose/phosphomannose isomerase [Bacteroidota bacterium]
MKNLISNFPAQVSEAIQIGKNASLTIHTHPYNKVVISGLGGSGIGASIVADYANDLMSIPLLVNKNYFIPRCVDTNTLFIACSYSGNTEETLQAVKLAKKSKAVIVCICSGGELATYAKKNKLPLILIPDGMPPRACLGYSMIQLLYVLHSAKLLKATFEKEIEQGLALIAQENKNIHKLAKEIAGKLLNHHIAIYTTVGYEGLAVRCRQQLNENSKVLAWHNVIPEMTHNEIVGWKQAHPEVIPVYCYSKSDFDKNLKRLQYLKKVVKKFSPHSVDILIKGDNYWQKTLYFINLTDWISVYLSDLNGNDAIEVKVIDGLKKEMSKK